MLEIFWCHQQTKTDQAGFVVGCNPVTFEAVVESRLLKKLLLTTTYWTGM